MPETLARYKTVLLLLLGLQLVRGLFYSAVVPPWQGPDEPWHYEYIQSVAQGEPRSGSEATPVDELESSLRTFNFWRFHGACTPEPGYVTLKHLVSEKSYVPFFQLGPKVGYSPVYHSLLAPLYALASPLDVASRLFLLRLTSVLLGMGTLFLAFLVAAALFPEDAALIVGIPAFILLLPMRTFLTSVVNSGNLADFWASLALFLMLTWFRDGLSLWRALGAVLAVILGVLTKRTDIFLVPLFLFAAALYAGRWIPREKSRRVALLPALVVLASLAALGLFVVYAGPLLQKGVLASFTAWGMDSERFFAAAQKGSLFTKIVDGANKALVTFWADFGWANVPLAWGWYKVLAAICLAVAVGLALYLLRLYRKADAVEKWRAEVIIFLLVALFLALVMGMMTVILLDRIQSRYFFPVIIPIAIFFLVGWRELFPPKYRRFAVPTCLAGLAMFDAVAVGYYLIPFYYS